MSKEPQTTPFFHIFHRWTRWEKYREQGTCVPRWGKAAGQTIPYTEDRQRRTCVICGKTEDILL